MVQRGGVETARGVVHGLLHPPEPVDQYVHAPHKEILVHSGEPRRTESRVRSLCSRVRGYGRAQRNPWASTLAGDSISSATRPDIPTNTPRSPSWDAAMSSLRKALVCALASTVLRKASTNGGSTPMAPPSRT